MRSGNSIQDKESFDTAQGRSANVVSDSANVVNNQPEPKPPQVGKLAQKVAAVIEGKQVVASSKDFVNARLKPRLFLLLELETAEKAGIHVIVAIA